MANVSFPNGLSPKRHESGAPWNGQLKRFAILASDATALGQGDVVKSAGTGDVTGVQAVTKVTSNTDVPMGVVIGFDVNYSNLNTPRQFRSANVAGYALVCVDPSVVYEVQSTGSAVVADIGLNCGYTFTAVNPVNGLSTVQADKATVATTATLPLKITGWVQRIDVDPTDATNMKIEVMLNTANLSNNTVGV